ncbi:unnamed protein product [Phytomonas sp. Hart1]|nr:unnamed protein product [Phytomonas sp. Hart1]|eukprot:CCW71371.1 unnamed protein product [Phytomonas sp. isolate Hart1]
MASEFFEHIITFIRKFLSLIIGLVLTFGVAIYVVGSSFVIFKDDNLGNVGFTHLIAILLSTGTTFIYLTLHFIPRKAYRLLYTITGLLLLSIFFCAHSLGLTVPTVSDCSNGNFQQMSVKSKGGSKDMNVVFGSIGQEIRTCSGNKMLLVGALITILMMIAAIFQVQMILLNRVRSKTYGERFVEMGISN